MDRIEELEAENERLKKVIAWANNSLFGSQTFFLSTNSEEENEHHLDAAIEELKSSNGEKFRENERLKALTEKAWKQADDANNAGLKSALRIAKLEAKQKILIDALKLIANDETDWPKNLAQNALGRGNY